MASSAADPPSIGASSTHFNWPLARLACSVHDSFAWCGSAFDPKRCVPLDRSWGERHRLSLLAQFAAHQSFLAFAGLTDHSFDAGEWQVVKARGADVRLIRTAAKADGQWTGTTPFDRVIEFAAFIGVQSGFALDRPWGRADHVYAEARKALLDGSAADLSGMIRASFGAMLAPGPEGIEILTSGPARVNQPDVFISLRNLATLSGRPFVRIGTEETNPLASGSGLVALEEIRSGLSCGDPASIADALTSVGQPILVVDRPERLDPKTRAVVDLLTDRGRQIAIAAPAADQSLVRPTVMHFVAPSAEASRTFSEHLLDVDRQLRFARLEEICGSDAYDRFLNLGLIPEVTADNARLLSIDEPARSFLAALALLGTEIDRDLGRQFLEKIGAKVELDDLAIIGVTRVSESRVIFESEAVRRKIESHLPVEMIDSLIDGVLELLGDDQPLVRYTLEMRRGNRSRALGILDHALDRGVIAPEEVSRILTEQTCRRDELRGFESIAIVEAERCMEEGAYRSVLDLVGESDHDRAIVLTGRALRRLGRYDEALAALERGRQTFDGLLLSGLLHRLRGNLDGAGSALSAAQELVENDLQQVWLDFERAILAIDCEEKPKVSWKRKATSHCPWLVARFEGYLALSRERFDEAAGCARRAIETAPDLTERIDAHVDLVYSRFMAGEWEEATRAAREALRFVEETEGDRAGGGLLYILGFLSADAGRWSEAENALHKLETFYDENHDERRKLELDLIRAQLAIGRLDYGAARRSALRVESCDVPEIRYAARLLLDELDWIAGSLSLPRVDGKSRCAELSRRTELMLARAGKTMEVGGFPGELLGFEREIEAGGQGSIPIAESASDRLTLLRSLDALQRRTGKGLFEARIEELCRLAGIDRRSEAESTSYRLLVALSSAEMPPAEAPIAGLEWRFAVRNRLGVWQQHGTLPLCEPNHLNAVSVDDEVIRIGESGLLWLQGEIDWTDELRRAVADLWKVKWEHRNLARLNEQMTNTIRDDVPVQEDGIIGESVALREALRAIPLAARSELAVTVEGETGTGKELVARAIHRRSSRRGRPFTPVNCSALPENLAESEFFGHVRGAFTGADRDRIGLIEATDGGTLFLDEIGEMPLSIQAKLLRFLQEGELRRVGDTETRSADVRIIAATNRTLEKEVDDGKFRQDLYYRIKGIEITLPPLRRRGRDVILLAHKFLADAREVTKAGPNGFTDDVEAFLLGHDWPGNVRDLQNVIGWAFSLAGDAPLITVDHLPQRVRNVAARPSKQGSFYEELAQFRRQMIEQSLLEVDGNQSRAAKNLGMTRQALAYQIKELGIHVRKQR